MKSVINDVADCVDDGVLGMVSQNPNLTIIKDQGRSRIVVHNSMARRVHIITGGGAGHEPFPIGFIGKGFFSGAVVGNVFTSPTSDSILRLLKYFGPSRSDVLMLILNYTGDRLNFAIAKERCKSSSKIELFACGDDSALTHPSRSAGRRGLCGSILIGKIICAMAEEEIPLDTLTQTAQALLDKIGTVGFSLDSCNVPGKGKLFKVGEDEIEVGLGIHGEAGIKTVKMAPASEICSMAISHMLNPDSESSVKVEAGDSVVVMLNNLGGTSPLEMSIFAKELLGRLREMCVCVVRFYNGTFMTSFDMRGIQFSILKVTCNDHWVRYLDAPTDALSWSETVVRPQQPHFSDVPVKSRGRSLSDNSFLLSDEEQRALSDCLSRACAKILANVDVLDMYDSGSGDGDCGSTLKRGVFGVQELLTQGELDFSQPASVMQSLSSSAENSMGGTSGALYCLFFGAAASLLEGIKVSTNLLKVWTSAFTQGLNTIKTYGGASRGDRTMVDCLEAVVETLEAASHVNKSLLAEVRSNAEKSALATTTMTAKAGRSANVSQQKQTNPDPGAWAVFLLVDGVTEALQDHLQ